MDQQKIGKFIASCRKEKQLTQQEVADELQITDKAVSKWETGRCLPDISFLEPLAKILDVDIVELIKGEHISSKEKESVNEVVEKVVDSTTNRNHQKRKKLNNWLTGGLVCYAVFALELHFHFFNIIGNVNLQEFARGLLMGATLYCYLMGYLENNRYINRIKETKKNYLRRL